MHPRETGVGGCPLNRQLLPLLGSTLAGPANSARSSWPGCNLGTGGAQARAARPLTSVRDPSRLERTTSQHPSPSISICLRRRSYLFLFIHNIPILCPLLLSDRKDSLHSSLPHLLPHRPAYFTHNVVPSCVSLLPLFPARVSGALLICRTVFADHAARSRRMLRSAHSADIGLIGLAVMGQNLILNMNGMFPDPGPASAAMLLS